MLVVNHVAMSSTVAIVLFATLISLSQTSTAFRVYSVGDIDVGDINEIPVLDKRASEMMADVSPVSDDDGREMNTVLTMPNQFADAAAAAIANDDDDDDDDDIEDEYYGDSASTILTTRRKRYTEYQENALAICAGDCMYQRRMSYGDCYEMCNWNGRTTSPWKKFDKQYQEQQQQQQQNYASRVLTHRFGQRKDSGATSSSTSSSKAQGRGKIKVKSGRPTGRQSAVSNAKTEAQNTKTSSRQKPVASTGNNGKANGTVGRCSR